MVNAAMRRSALNFRYRQLYNKKLAFMRKQAYMSGEGIARDSRCPLCRQQDSGGHIAGGCLHRDMKKQYIARHDKAMRAVVQAFTKGSLGSFYLIANVGRLEGLKELGVHSKRVPAFVLPDRYLQGRNLDPQVGRDFLHRGVADSRSKMRPDIMIVEMTAAEQQTYIPFGDMTGATLPTLPALMQNGKARRIWIVEGGYCSDTQYEDKLKEKEGQHMMLQTALEGHGYQVQTLPIIIGVSGSHFHTTTQALNQLGSSYDAAKTLLLKLHEHSITCLHNIVTSSRVLERAQNGNTRKPPP